MFGCGCCGGGKQKKIIYKCDDKNCDTTKEFDKEPSEKPTCCGKPMKKVS